MHIEIRTRGFEMSETLRSRVRRARDFTFARYAGRIRAAVVKLSELDAAHGGPTPVCEVVLHLRSGAHVAARCTDAHLHAAIDRACARATRALALRLRRSHTARARLSSPLYGYGG